jgi:hypothetical protein
MVKSRRTFLLDGMIFLGVGRYGWSQEFPPVELEFRDVELDPKLPLVAAANTSGFTTCQLQVRQNDGKILWQSKEWSTEPNVSNSASTKRLGGDSGKGRVVRAVMRPTRAHTPSMAIAIHQGDELNKTQIESLAEKARFVADPAQRPNGGHFEVHLYYDSTVKVRIWRGTVASGPPVYQNQLQNVQAGDNRVPWDLQMKGGSQAAPGRYVAILDCKPNQADRVGTLLCSSFGVV